MRFKFFAAAAMLMLLWPAQLTHATGAGFTVAPQIPANQRTNVSSYWDLVVKPGQVQPLALNLTNRTPEVRRLKVSLTTARSQTNGQVGYQPGAPLDDSAQYRIESLGEKPQVVTLNPNQSQPLTLHLKIPQRGFSGVMLGGVYVEDLADTHSSQGGVGIKNHFATVVGLQLQTTTGAINQIKPHLRLENVGAAIDANQAAVVATVQNDRPAYWGKMHWDAKVMPRNSTRVLMHRDAADFSMAPNSHVGFALSNGEALRAGDYTLDMNITGPHGHWHFKRNFSILAAQAERINHKLHLKPKALMPWWGWVALALLILAAGFGAWWFWRRRKKAEVDESTD